MNEAERDALAKTNRINMLFDFYGPLLTEKQRTFLTYYFHDDYSLGEIAEEFAVSRQAIYEHIKRAETMLEEYEAKLQLLVKHERRQELAASFHDAISSVNDDALRKKLQGIVSELVSRT